MAENTAVLIAAIAIVAIVGIVGVIGLVGQQVTVTAATPTGLATGTDKVVTVGACMSSCLKDKNCAGAEAVKVAEGKQQCIDACISICTPAKSEQICGCAADGCCNAYCDFDPDCCVCSGTACEPGNTGMVCDGCFYVTAPPEGTAYEKSCVDGIDNDCDGLADAKDPDCCVLSITPLYVQDLTNIVENLTATGGAVSLSAGGYYLGSYEFGVGYKDGVTAPTLSPLKLEFGKMVVYASESITITYDKIYAKTIYLPYLDSTSGAVYLYVAADGSTYYDEKLTRLAYSACGLPQPPACPYKCVADKICEDICAKTAGCVADPDCAIK